MLLSYSNCSISNPYFCLTQSRLHLHNSSHWPVETFCFHCCPRHWHQQHYVWWIIVAVNLDDCHYHFWGIQPCYHVNRRRTSFDVDVSFHRGLLVWPLWSCQLWNELWVPSCHSQIVGLYNNLFEYLCTPKNELNFHWNSSSSCTNMNDCL